MSVMSRYEMSFCVFATVLLLVHSQPWMVASAAVLVPPKGYSVGFTGTTQNGLQKYVCTRGEWSKTGASADVYAPDGTKLGTYRAVYDQATREKTYYWNIINSEGTYFESGQAISGLQASPLRAVEVATSAISEYLAIIKVHRYAGDASQVAFVSLTGTQGGLPPRIELCSSHGATCSVPFKGNFTFYNQDRQPPTGIPASLKPEAKFMQVVFLDGKVQYKFTKNGQWRLRGMFATIADVAGGNLLGKFGTGTETDKYGSKLYFRFKDPNGFWLAGQKATKPVQITADGFPWQLLKITTSGGTVFPAGKITYVLIGSTIGGLPPRIAGRTAGMTWGSPFTAQCYLYVGKM